MKLTNKFGLPTTFVNAIKRPQYSKGDSHISATEILSSPRIVQLRSMHWEETESDVSEMVWSLFGTAVHNILEHGKDDHHIVEERLHADIGGWSISGAIDLQEVFEDGIVVSDYKVTGAWTVMQEKKDWENQLNIYGFLVEFVKKIPVKKIQIVAIIRDWSAREAKTREGYPQAPIVIMEMNLWPMEKRTQYVEDRIALHNEAYFAAKTGSELAYCTPEECWEKPTYYAVKKIGGVKAKKVFTIRSESESLIAELGEKYELEVREGERTRCKSYCSVSKFCNQYDQYLNMYPTTEEA